MNKFKQLVNTRIEKIKGEYVALQNTKKQLQEQYDGLKTREIYLENAFNELMLLLEDVDTIEKEDAVDTETSSDGVKVRITNDIPTTAIPKKL